MKKLASRFLVLIAVITTLASCDKNESRPVPVPDPPKEPETEQPETSKDIKILAIGNSFSVDAMEYLYGMLKDVGYETITLGNLYIGGCSLEKHLNCFENNSESYTFYLNTTGEWTSTVSYKPLIALGSEDWDIITMQQSSPNSGLEETYEPFLSKLIKRVRLYCPDAQLAWHMTWAYQGDSSHSGFSNYGKDQKTMYEAIVNAVQTNILTNTDFVKVIPSGTAVQNMRTSFVGDNLTRDGYHMSYDKGRYLIALTFAKALTGCDLADISYTPSEYTYSGNLIAAMKDAVEKSCANPYTVTASAYPETDINLAEAYPEQIMEYYGYNMSDYTALNIDFTDFAFYKSTADYMSKMYTVSNYQWNSTICDYIATQIFSRDDLPEGSIIVQRNVQIYRPEGWINLNQKNTSRPGNVSSELVVVNDEWWGEWNYRAFNIAFADKRDLGKNPLIYPDAENLCPQLRSGFAIYVPKK